MLKRGLLLAVFAVVLFSAFSALATARPLIWNGCYDDSDCAWSISNDATACLYNGNCQRSWWTLSGSCSYSSACTVNYGYTCTSNGCQSICPTSGSCENNLYTYYTYTGSLDPAKGQCEKKTTCTDSCCPSGQSCVGGVCKSAPLLPTCVDNDGDTYPSNAVACGKSASLQDCNDDPLTGGSVNPGVTEASCDADTIDNDCKNGDAPTCDPPPPQPCVADGIVSSTEKCDPLVSSGSQVCGDYGTISYGCKSDCTWETVSCPYCGDKTVQLPEQCEPGVSSGTLVCDSGTISYGCKNDGSCTWESATCPQPPQPPQPQPPQPLWCRYSELSCGDWAPATCPSTGQQTRTCTLINIRPESCVNREAFIALQQDIVDRYSTQTCTPGDVTSETCSDRIKNQGETGIDCGGPCTAPSCTLTQGVCAGKTKTCQTSTGSWTDCSISDYGPNYQGVESKCDGLDNDCDGITDEVGIGFQKAGAACDTSSPVVPNPCSGVELDSSKTCCQSAGFIWAASGEENVDEKTFGSFTQYRQEGCVGDDAGEFISYRQCRAGVCDTDVTDFAACNSNRDCVYSAKCYSDIKEVAANNFGGDIGQVWGSRFKERSYHNVNADVKTLEVCDPGFWGAAGGEVGGKVTDIEGKAIASAQVKIIGTTFITATAADGSYSFDGVVAGTYDMVASKAGTQFGDTLKAGQNVPGFGTTTVDFTLTLPKGDCNDDCTKADGFCHSECQGKGQCSFYTEETRSVCDFSVPGIVDYSGKQVLCCKGNLYTPLKANVKIDADNVITRRIPVLRQGKLVNVVIAVFNRRA